MTKPNSPSEETQARHTPAPWEVSFPKFGFCVRSSATMDRVAMVDAGNRDGSLGEANARLIAAAPDLLEALKEAKFYLVIEGYASSMLPDDHAVLKQIKAAIAKAEGREGEARHG